MDEYLFIEVAKLQADRRRLEREQREQAAAPGVGSVPVELNSSRTPASAVVCQPMEQAVMKTFIAVLASFAVNGGLLGGLAYSVTAVAGAAARRSADRAAAG